MIPCHSGEFPFNMNILQIKGIFTSELPASYRGLSWGKDYCPSTSSVEVMDSQEQLGFFRVKDWQGGKMGASLLQVRAFPIPPGNWIIAFCFVCFK